MITETNGSFAKASLFANMARKMRSKLTLKV